MKIVFLAKGLPPLFDAVGAYACKLGNRFVQQGHEVSYICDHSNKTSDNVFPVVEKWNIRSVNSIYRTICELKPDIFFIQMIPYSYNRFGIPLNLSLLLLLLRWKGIQTHIMFHEVCVRYTYFHPKGIVLNAISFAQRMHTFVMAKLANAVSTSNFEYARTIGIASVSVIPVGSNIEKVEFASQDAIAWRDQITFTQKKIIVTFGSNLRDTISAIERCYKAGMDSDLVFLILGKLGAKDLERLKQFPESFVKRTGYLEEEDVFKYLAVSDAFLMTFQKLRGEKNQRAGANTKSGSLAAAFVAGLPVITHKGFLTDPVFQDGVNCYFLKRNDTEIAEELLSIVKDDDLLNNLRKGAIAFYSEINSWDVISKAFIELFAGQLAVKAGKKST